MTITLGSEITKLRKALHLTQIQLSDQICTQATISMIEKDEIKPGLDILYALSLRLKKPLAYFANILLDDHFPYTSTIVSELENFTTHHRYNEVYNIVKRELSHDALNDSYKACLQWNYYISSYKLGKITIEEALIGLKAITQTYSTLALQKDFLLDKIYNSIAFLYATNKNYEQAMFYFNKIDLIFPKLQESPRLKTEIYHLRVLYNKVKTYFDMGDYENCLEDLQLGIEYSKKLENMSLIGNFYYYKGEIETIHNAPFETIQNSFQQAYFFFKLLDRKVYMQILEQEKKQYIAPL